MASAAGPRSRSASTRVPSCAPCTAWICNVRDSESGLYCRAIMLCTADVFGSMVTMPPFTKRGELGKPVMAFLLEMEGGHDRAGDIARWRRALWSHVQSTLDTDIARHRNLFGKRVIYLQVQHA